jgi:hypothetical protein
MLWRKEKGLKGGILEQGLKIIKKQVLKIISKEVKGLKIGY